MKYILDIVTIVCLGLFFTAVFVVVQNTLDIPTDVFTYYLIGVSFASHVINYKD